MNITHAVLGVDLGNTLIKKREPIPGSLDILRRLIDDIFGERVHIISRVNEEQEVRARIFVTTEPFTSTVAIPISRVHFCRERHEKGDICRTIGVTHMVDDRPEVMAHLPPSVTHRILFNPDNADLLQWGPRIKNCKMFVARTWIEVEEYLRRNHLE